MQKVLAIAILALAAVPAVAQHRGPHGHHGHHNNYHHRGNSNWVAPLILGGVVGYAITRNNEQVVVQQPPVLVQQPTVIYATPYCGPWTETLQSDGTVVRQRTCTQ